MSVSVSIKGRSPDQFVKWYEHYLIERVRKVLHESFTLTFTSQYEPMRCAYRFTLQIRVDKMGVARAIHHEIDEAALRGDFNIEDMLMELFSPRHVRTEIIQLKLSKHFPVTLKSVEETGLPASALMDLIVTFTNERQVAVREDKVFDDEFLAKCAMIHDL